PPSLLASNALQAVGSGAMVRLQSLQGGAVHLCALEVMEGHPVRDKTVGELNLPQGALVVAIVREGVVVPPDPDQIIGIGDEVFLMTEAALENDVAASLLGEAHLMGDVIEPLPLGDL